MQYFLTIIYLLLFLATLFLGIYNLIYSQRTATAEQKIGIRLPKLIIRWLNITTFISLATALVFAILLTVSLFTLRTPYTQ